MQIPPGARIVSARLKVYSVQSGWITVNLNLGAEATGNSAVFSSSNLPSQRTLTTSKVSHSSNVPWIANTWYDFDEMAPVVQEVISRSEWRSGNSLSIIMKGTGTAWSRKFIQDYSLNPAHAVKLVIIYR